MIANTLEKSQRRPSFVELLTYVESATKIVNDRPLTPLSDDPRDFTAITPASLLTPYSSPYCVVGSPQHKDNLRRDYCFNISLSEQFWKKMAGVLPTLATGEKEVVENGTEPNARTIGNLNLNGRCIKMRQIPTWEGA